MRFVPVDTTNTYLLEQFIQRAGKSLETFRYYSKRPFSIVRNHLCTWVIEEGGQVEAYGHLDREGNTVWLGIAVTFTARGKGFGRKMMQRLMESGKDLGIPVIRLLVDNENRVAIRLYERFGFRVIDKGATGSHYEWKQTRVPTECEERS
jgi:ribosomal protein S18 acetylase RimI-like enzyme